MTPDINFWRGRRVLVTGHTGFKGSWLCLWLHTLGARVWGLALPPPTDPALFNLAQLPRIISSTEGDVRDLDVVRAVVRSAEPEVVFHLAAQSLVRVSYQDPLTTYTTNVIGTANVLEAARAVQSIRSIVIVTSDKCYENLDGRELPFTESDPLGGWDPYSSSKGCAEIVTSAYRRSYFSSRDAAGKGTGVASARAGNVIGGGDWAKDRLIPDAMNAFNRREPFRVRNPHAIRPWQHVLEPLRGYLTLGERLARGQLDLAEAWNFGPAASDAWPVAKVADRLTSLWGSDARWNAEVEGDAPHEAKFLSLSIDKAINRLGYRPNLDLSTALEWVVEWYRGFFKGIDAATLTRDQIEKYQRRITP